MTSLRTLLTKAVLLAIMLAAWGIWEIGAWVVRWVMG